MGRAELRNGVFPGDNRMVMKADERGQSGEGGSHPFSSGTLVVVTLGNPREKFWGAVLGLSAQGLSLSGIELGSFEDLVSLIKEGEPFSASVVFFPMHRLERVELDLPDGSISSLSQRFTAKTGLDAATVLMRHGGVRPDAGEERK
jgi:hypothetical protein